MSAPARWTRKSFCIDKNKITYHSQVAEPSFAFCRDESVLVGKAACNFAVVKMFFFFLERKKIRLMLCKSKVWRYFRHHSWAHKVNSRYEPICLLQQTFLAFLLWVGFHSLPPSLLGRQSKVEAMLFFHWICHRVGCDQFPVPQTEIEHLSLSFGSLLTLASTVEEVQRLRVFLSRRTWKMRLTV